MECENGFRESCLFVNCFVALTCFNFHSGCCSQLTLCRIIRRFLGGGWHLVRTWSWHSDASFLHQWKTENSKRYIKNKNTKSCTFSFVTRKPPKHATRHVTLRCSLKQDVFLFYFTGIWWISSCCGCEVRRQYIEGVCHVRVNSCVVTGVVLFPKWLQANKVSAFIMLNNNLALCLFYCFLLFWEKNLQKSMNTRED